MTRCMLAAAPDFVGEDVLGTQVACQAEHQRHPPQRSHLNITHTRRHKTFCRTRAHTHGCTAGGRDSPDKATNTHAVGQILRTQAPPKRRASQPHQSHTTLFQRRPEPLRKIFLKGLSCGAERSSNKKRLLLPNSTVLTALMVIAGARRGSVISLLLARVNGPRTVFRSNSWKSTAALRDDDAMRCHEMRREVFVRKRFSADLICYICVPHHGWVGGITSCRYVPLRGRHLNSCLAK